MFHTVAIADRYRNKSPVFNDRTSRISLLVFGILVRYMGSNVLDCCPWYRQSVVGILDSFESQLAKLEQFTEAVYSLRGDGAHQRAL